MSQNRQDTRLAVDSQLGAGGGFTPHRHEVHQLTWAVDGSFAIAAQSATWFVTAHVGLWLPATIVHEVLAERSAVMRSLYFRVDGRSPRWSGVTPVGTHGLVGALLDHLVRAEEGQARRRAEQVLFDVLEEVPQVVVSAPTIDDDRGRRVAEALTANPADSRTVDDWGRMVGASGRTLARVIERETGLTFSRWRNQIRIAHAARELAAGRSVSEVAHAVGFATSSAFVACFRQFVGQTPGAYAAQARRASAPPQVRPGIALTIVQPGTRVDPTNRIARA